MDDRHLNDRHRPRAVVFDVIGTLFSLESQRRHLVACGLPGHALEAWFAASLRDLFALGVTGRTAPMRAVLDGMSRLDPDPEAGAALGLLHANGLACAALSNGSLQATETLLDRAGLPKPRGEVYRAMAARLRLEPGSLTMVAAHPWDL